MITGVGVEGDSGAVVGGSNMEMLDFGLKQAIPHSSQKNMFIKIMCL